MTLFISEIKIDDLTPLIGLRKEGELTLCEGLLYFTWKETIYVIHYLRISRLGSLKVSDGQRSLLNSKMEMTRSSMPFYSLLSFLRRKFYIETPLLFYDSLFLPCLSSTLHL